jgi:RNase P/RNase MRP subunit p29
MNKVVNNTTRLIIRPLLGFKTSVVDSTNASNCNLHGHIVDETSRTLTLFDGVHKRIIPKAGVFLKMTLPTGENVQLDGRMILGHPAEKLRRAKRLRW